jgi:hypothetical protein
MFFDASLYQVGYHVCLFQVREELFQGFKRIMDTNKDDINEDYYSSAKIFSSTENPIHDKENPKMEETNMRKSFILKNKFRNLIRSGFYLPPIGSPNENDAVFGDSIGSRGSRLTELTVRKSKSNEFRESSITEMTAVKKKTNIASSNDSEQEDNQLNQA